MDVKLYTIPDIDYSNNIKLLFVDFEPITICDFAHIFNVSNNNVTVYVYNTTDNNPEWLLNAAGQATAILVNCDNRSNFEMLKGYLLSFKNASAFGKNDQVIFAKNTYYDIAVWFTDVAKTEYLVDAAIKSS